MQDLKILEVLDKLFTDKYNATTDLEVIGHSISKANAILKYKEGDIQIVIKVSKKAALQQYFDYMKTKGKFKNIDYEKFEEKYQEGIALDKIEKEVKKEQLPLD